jgi:hypothetical protein
MLRSRPPNTGQKYPEIDSHSGKDIIPNFDDLSGRLLGG